VQQGSSEDSRGQQWSRDRARTPEAEQQQLDSLQRGLIEDGAERDERNLGDLIVDEAGRERRGRTRRGGQGRRGLTHRRGSFLLGR
jgi:hypothetical protein